MIGPVESRTVIRLVRHGESTWNAAGRVQGQHAAAGPLTARGRQESEAAAEGLAGDAPRARIVVSSDLPRALETAEIVARRLHRAIETDPGLREQALGVLEGRVSGPEVAQEFRRLWRDPWPRPEGGESVAELYVRVRNALSGIAERWPGVEVIAITHGGPIRAAVAACGGGVIEMQRSRVSNAAVFAVQVSRPRLGRSRVSALPATSRS
jgi:probable phosphoglycerate mutase